MSANPLQGLEASIIVGARYLREFTVSEMASFSGLPEPEVKAALHGRLSESIEELPGHSAQGEVRYRARTSCRVAASADEGGTGSLEDWRAIDLQLAAAGNLLLAKLPKARTIDQRRELIARSETSLSVCRGELRARPAPNSEAFRVRVDGLRMLDGFSAFAKRSAPRDISTLRTLARGLRLCLDAMFRPAPSPHSASEPVRAASDTTQKESKGSTPLLFGVPPAHVVFALKHHEGRIVEALNRSREIGRGLVLRIVAEDLSTGDLTVARLETEIPKPRARRAVILHGTTHEKPDANLS